MSDETPGVIRRDNQTYIEINGEMRSVPEWSAVSGILPELILMRLSRGWLPEDAVHKAPRSYKRLSTYWQHPVRKVRSDKGQLGRPVDMAGKPRTAARYIATLDEDIAAMADRVFKSMPHSYRNPDKPANPKDRYGQTWQNLMRMADAFRDASRELKELADERVASLGPPRPDPRKEQPEPLVNTETV